MDSRKIKPVRCMTAALSAALACVCGTALARDLQLDQDLQLNRVVAVTADRLQLTQDGALFQSASAFSKTPLNLSAGSSFDATVTFRIEGGTLGADGMTLALVQGPTTYFGHSGGNLGLWAAPGPFGMPSVPYPALAVALDTFSNTAYGDIGDNNVVLLDSLSLQHGQSVAAPFDLNDGNTHVLRVRFDGARTLLSVDLAESEASPFVTVLTETIDVPRFFNYGQAAIGVTAATGGGTNSHIVTRFSVSPVPEPGTLALCFAGAGLVLSRVRRLQQHAG